MKLNSTTTVDLHKLIETRLLVQANSGGGKSWAIRKLIEEAFGKVQIIVIDPEGEFINLREKFDFVYAGKEGDAPVESRSAALLAKRLLELKASAIVDLYELPPQERKKFVRLFLDAMVNAPKELWHDCLVIIDEAHVFAPEKGESEAMGPVIDLATRGRKRGYCVVLATQRISKMHKDAAAECNNKLIGRASLDIDRKRAAEELGFTSKEQILSLRDLEPGEFYAFGPAISREVAKIKIGEVKVKPPLRGAGKHAPPPPTEKVRKILSKLSDLPQEAQREAQTVAELKQQVALLTRQLRTQKPVEIVQDESAIKRAMQSRDKEWEGVVRVANKEIERLATKINQIAKIIGTEGENVRVVNHPQKMTPTPAPLPAKVQFAPDTKGVYSQEPDGELTGPEQRILDAIAMSESIGVGEPEVTAVAFLAGYRVGGGAFNNPKGRLRAKGLIEYRGKNLLLTEAGKEKAQYPIAPLSQEELHDKVFAILPTPEQKLLKPLIERYPEALSMEDLATASGYEKGGGAFNNPRGRLKTLGLVEYPSAGYVRARDILFIH